MKWILFWLIIQVPLATLVGRLLRMQWEVNDGTRD